MLSRLKQSFARIGAFFRSADLDRDLDAELESHLNMLTDENISRGMSPEKARRAAAVALGNSAHLREAHRETRGLPLVDTLLQDLRYTFRILRRDLEVRLDFNMTLIGGVT